MPGEGRCGISMKNLVDIKVTGELIDPDRGLFHLGTDVFYVSARTHFTYELNA